MNNHKDILTFFILASFIGLTACLNHSNNKPLANKAISDSLATSSVQTNSAPTEDSAKQKEELTKIYTIAIAEFIKAAYKKDKTTFDTLYFGKHVYGQPDDFPNIELPTSIENTQIRLVTPEIGQKKQAERRMAFYINMMGWVDKENAQFKLVVFSNGVKHQYDYFLGFNFNKSTNNFVLDKIDFENYLDYNGQKPKRINIYKDRKYIMGK